MVKPGSVVRARVQAATNHGIHLESDGIQILVHVVDVEWYRTVRPADYASVGDELDVKILRVTKDGRVAAGWLPWPRRPGVT